MTIRYDPERGFPQYQVFVGKGEERKEYWLDFYETATKLDEPEVALGEGVTDEKDKPRRGLTEDERYRLELIAIELGNSATGAMPK
jgi:hypothetical protein